MIIKSHWCYIYTAIITFVIRHAVAQVNKNPKCPSQFGLFPEPSSCKKYISCWAGRGYRLTCGRNMIFNPATLTCQSGGKCISKMISPSSGEIVRLSGNAGQGSGLLQVRTGRKWVWVSNIGFKDEIADLVCRRMGYDGFSSWMTSGVNHQSFPFSIVICPKKADKLQRCSTRPCTPIRCGYADRTIFIRCNRESTSRCPPNSKSWRRWKNKCYMQRQDFRQTKEEASELCKQFSGSLAQVNSQLEHEYISSLLSEVDPNLVFYTDGSSRLLPNQQHQWTWATTRSTFRYQKWWTGWNSTASSNPAAAKVQGSSSACLILKRSFSLRNEISTNDEMLDSGFSYFSASNCNDLRPFICQAPLIDFGCVSKTGKRYSGSANYSRSGLPCLSWNDPTVNNVLGRSSLRRPSRSFDLSLLGSHNYCRNPNGSPKPWCFVSSDDTEECDIPICSSHTIETVVETPTRVVVPSSTTSSSKPPTTRASLLNPFRTSTSSQKPNLITFSSVTAKKSNALKVRCKSSEYQCDHSSLCLSENKLCDGTRQCLRGDDERSCRRYVRKMETHINSTMIVKDIIMTIFREETGVCSKRCLDEAFCKGFLYYPQNRKCELSRLSAGESGLLPSTNIIFYEVSSRKLLCTNMFKCSNKRCVSKLKQCNGGNDCGDNSDEADCSRTVSHQIRLIGGSIRSEGNIEIKIKNEWKYICDDNFGWEEADRVCKDLKYSGAFKFTRNNHFGNSRDLLRKDPNFWISNLNCSGHEGNILSCKNSGVGHHQCGSTEIAGVICRNIGRNQYCRRDQYQCNNKICIPRTHVCNGVYNCPDLSDEDPKLCQDYGIVKLQRPPDKPGEAVGTILIKNNGGWGTVCDDSFDESHAKVVCRSLGYDGEWSVAYSKAHFGSGKGGVLIDEPGCLGHEKRFEDCPKHVWGPGNCDHTEDAGVFCSDKPKIRLADGKSSNEGRVEVFLGGQWGTICDADFDDYDATVLCRMMGYIGGGTAEKKAKFGKGTGPIWIDNLDCRGEETTISHCRKSPTTTSACTHSEDAGVICLRESQGKQIDGRIGRKLATSCGASVPSFFQSNLAKIVGGKRTTQIDHPWLVSLQLQEKGRKKHNCGGVVIAEDYVLTAAHCFRNHGKQSYVVRAGEFDLERHEEHQEDFDIEKLWIPDEFDQTVEFNNDIALLKIARKRGRGIRLGGTLQPVCLPEFDSDYRRLHNCVITGWGTTDEKSDPIPQRTPLTGRVKVYPVSSCISANSYKSFEVTSSMICAGQMDGSVDTCTGDSGGPMTCKVNGRHVLYGITSWGKGCGRKMQPGMYTKVTKFLRWLESHLT